MPRATTIPIAIIGVLAIAGAALFWPSPAHAADITIPIDTFLDELTGSTTDIVTVTTGPFEGRTCEVFVNGVNNDSVHVNNNLIASSGGGSVTAFDVERAPLADTQAEGQLVLGPTITVSVFIGNDDSGSNGDGTTNGFFSGGHDVEVTCLPVVTTTVVGVTTTTVPGSTTTVPGSTTTVPGSTTTVPGSTIPTTTNPNVTNTSQPSGGSGSSGGGGSDSDTASGGLPVTGSGNTVAMLLVALALIAGGFLLLRSTRTPDTPTDD